MTKNNVISSPKTSNKLRGKPTTLRAPKFSQSSRSNSKEKTDYDFEISKTHSSKFYSHDTKTAFKDLFIRNFLNERKLMTSSSRCLS